jgi:hypothetical protein
MKFPLYTNNVSWWHRFDPFFLPFLHFWSLFRSPRTPICEHFGLPDFQNIQHALFHEFEDEIKLAFPSEGLNFGPEKLPGPVMEKNIMKSMKFRKIRKNILNFATLLRGDSRSTNSIQFPNQCWDKDPTEMKSLSSIIPIHRCISLLYLQKRI